jgi:hypothetical protein
MPLDKINNQADICQFDQLFASVATIGHCMNHQQQYYYYRDRLGFRSFPCRSDALVNRKGSLDSFAELEE